MTKLRDDNLDGQTVVIMALQRLEPRPR
jgi:hypothetical protein